MPQYFVRDLCLFLIGIERSTLSQLASCDHIRRLSLKIEVSALHLSCTQLVCEKMISLDTSGIYELTELGIKEWEKAHKPRWENSVVHGVDGTSLTITTASELQLFRTFAYFAFLQCVEPESFCIEPIDGFFPLYWKYVTPALRIQFERDTIVELPFLLHYYTTNDANAQDLSLVWKRFAERCIIHEGNLRRTLVWYDVPVGESE